MKGVKKTSRQTRTAQFFVLSILLICSSALIWSTWSAEQKYINQQQQLLETSAKGVAREIVLQINELRRSVRLFAQSEETLIEKIAKQGDNEDVYKLLMQHVKASFPLALSVMIADLKGNHLINGFGVRIGEKCKSDIIFFAKHGSPAGVHIHPDNVGHHVDIMVAIDLDFYGSSIFYISFKPDIFVNLLANSEVFQYKLLLLFQNNPDQIELTSAGVQKVLSKEGQTITPNQYNRILYRMPIEQTRWELAYLAKQSAGISSPLRMWIETSILLLILVALSLTMLRQALRAERQILNKNEILALQANKLEDAQRKAESANKSKSTFLANMSHELRTPLTAIVGYSEMLHEDAEDNGHNFYLHDLQMIQAASNDLLNLINTILDLSKIEAGKMDVYYKTFSINPFLDEVIKTVQPLIDKNANKLEIKCHPTVGDITMDRQKMGQILLNLLGNAAKFTETGKISLSVERLHRAKHDLICFEIKDNGIGMSTSEMNTLFSEFTQGHRLKNRNYGGTGLGLAISRRFCELMGGDISVSSELGVGTCFTARIPAIADKQGYVEIA